MQILHSEAVLKKNWIGGYFRLIDRLIRWSLRRIGNISAK